MQESVDFHFFHFSLGEEEDFYSLNVCGPENNQWICCSNKNFKIIRFSKLNNLFKSIIYCDI